MSLVSPIPPQICMARSAARTAVSAATILAIVASTVARPVVGLEPGGTPAAEPRQLDLKCLLLVAELEVYQPAARSSASARGDDFAPRTSRMQRSAPVASSSGRPSSSASAMPISTRSPCVL